MPSIVDDIPFSFEPKPSKVFQWNTIADNDDQLSRVFGHRVIDNDNLDKKLQELLHHCNYSIDLTNDLMSGLEHSVVANDKLPQIVREELTPATTLIEEVISLFKRSREVPNKELVKIIGAPKNILPQKGYCKADADRICRVLLYVADPANCAADQVLLGDACGLRPLKNEDLTALAQEASVYIKVRTGVEVMITPETLSKRELCMLAMRKRHNDEL